MRWTLSVLFLGIAVVASVLGLLRVFWDASRTNHSLLLGGFLLLTCVAVVGAIPRSRLRGGFVGASLFGIAFLACVLKGGFGLETIYDSQALARNAKLGMALMAVAFLTCQWCAMVTWPSDSLARRNAERTNR